MTVQIPWLILPQSWSIGTETETVADLLEHTSIEVWVRYLQEKTIHILATEVVMAPGVPGNLLCWVELSPYSSAVSAFHWAAIGAPLVLVGTGVNLAQQTAMMAWTMHSDWARVVIWTPAPVAAAFWAVQVLISGKG